MTPCIVFVALRSTGPDAVHDRVIHLVASVLNPSMTPKVFNSYVNPGDTHITAALEKSLGVKVGSLRTERTIGPVMESFFRYCQAMRGNRQAILVGHNAHHFQWPLLTHELRRSRIKIPNHLDLWDSLHAVRAFNLSSCRPREILNGRGHVVAPGAMGDIQATVTILEVLSRAGRVPPFDPAPDRIFNLLEFTNMPFINAQRRNQSNQFKTRWLQVNVTEGKIPPAESSPAYDPDFIPDVVSEPEPDPAPKGLEVYDHLCRWVDHFYPEKNQNVLDFAELIQARHNYGKQKYNQPLMTGDGRDDLEDARQELGDLAMYVTKALMNHREVDKLKGFWGVIEALMNDKEFFEPETSVPEISEKPDDNDNHESTDVGDVTAESP